jgi:hypothetical protein
MKQGTHRYVIFYSQTPATASLEVDLQTCTVLRIGSTTSSYNVTTAKNGFCYVMFTYTQSGVVAYPSFSFLKDAVSPFGTSWTSAGTETFYAWGVSFQLASAPADYLATTGSTATLGPLCPFGYAQSKRDPSRCYSVSTTPPNITIAPFTTTNN